MFHLPLQLFGDAEDLRETGRKMRKEGESLWSILNDIGKKVCNLL